MLLAFSIQISLMLASLCWPYGHAVQRVRTLLLEISKTSDRLHFSVWALMWHTLAAGVEILFHGIVLQSSFNRTLLWIPSGREAIQGRLEINKRITQPHRLLWSSSAPPLAMLFWNAVFHSEKRQKYIAFLSSCQETSSEHWVLLILPALVSLPGHILGAAVGVLYRCLRSVITLPFNMFQQLLGRAISLCLSSVVIRTLDGSPGGAESVGSKSRYLLLLNKAGLKSLGQSSKVGEECKTKRSVHAQT